MSGSDPTPDRAGVVPLLVSRFEQIRQAPSADVTLENMPIVFGESSYREHCFDEAKNSWLTVFNKEKVLRAVTSDPKEEYFRYLKDIRKFGLILKSGYRFFGKTHMCPDGLDTFVRNIGRYNDHYWSSSTKSPFPADTMEALDHLDGESLSISYGTTEEFKAYAEGVFLRIESVLHGRAKSISVRDLHSLRKCVRLFSNIMQVPAAEHVTEPQHLLFHRLYNLSGTLASVRDNQADGTATDQINKDELMVDIDPFWAEEWDRVSSSVRRALDLPERTANEPVPEIDLPVDP